MGSSILESCLKKLKPEVTEKVKDLGDALKNKSSGGSTSPTNKASENEAQLATAKSKIEGNTKIKIKGNLDALEGRKDTTPDELNAIGIRKKDNEDIELTDEEIERINRVRNGYDSVEDFLKSDPKEHDYVILFMSDRVKMAVDSYGDVDFTIDGAYDARKVEKNAPKPTKELVQMAKQWETYTNSKAGERIFTNTPYKEENIKNEVDDRSKTRTEAYERFGFKTRNIYDDDSKTVSGEPTIDGQILDNRKHDPVATREFLYKKSYFGIGIKYSADREETQNEFKDKFIKLSPEQKRNFVAAKSTDELMKSLNVVLPDGWETSGKRGSPLVELMKTFKTAESNFNDKNKFDAKTFLSAFPPNFIKELLNNKS